MNKLLSIFFLLFTSFILGQNIGSLNGRILGIQSQQPLPGATVLLEGTGIGVVTDDEGYFIINDIPSKSYNIVASFLGYQNETLYNVIVKSVGNRPILFELEEVTETLDEVVIVRSPFRTTRDTPLSTQSFSAVEIETYPGEITTLLKWFKVCPEFHLPLEDLEMTL